MKLTKKDQVLIDFMAPDNVRTMTVREAAKVHKCSNMGVYVKAVNLMRKLSAQQLKDESI